MSTQSVKAASRPAKSGKRNGKKTIKAARSAATKSSKTVSRTKAAAAARVTRPAVAIEVTHAAAAIIRTASPPVQPPAEVSVVRLPHRYQVGELVYYTSPSFGRTSASGNYTVVKQLPSEGDDYQYRIKSTGEAFERVARESQLESA